MSLKLKFRNMEMTPKGAKAMEAITWLVNHEVRAGLQRGNSKYEDGTDVLDVAITNEFGTSKIPSRPFMEQSLERNKDDYHKECEVIFASAIEGKKVDVLLELLSEKLKYDIQDEIDTKDFVPNAPYTIAKKGFDFPLYETGLLQKSINNYVKETEVKK